MSGHVCNSGNAYREATRDYASDLLEVGREEGREEKRGDGREVMDTYKGT